MDALRKPFFVAALVCALVVVLIEVGSAAFLAPKADNADTSGVKGSEGLDAAELTKFKSDCQSRGGKTPPGLGIPAQATLDALILWIALWMGLSLLVPEKVAGRLQGVVNFVVALIVLLVGLAAVFFALTLLMAMVALLLAAPFGTIAYLVLYGHFPTPAAAVVLSLIMTCKLAFAGCLVLAHQRFVQNRTLVALILTSLVMTIVISFLHGFVPGPLVSIADAVAAIVCAILAIIWSIPLLLTSLIGVIKAIV